MLEKSGTVVLWSSPLIVIAILSCRLFLVRSIRSRRVRLKNYHKALHWSVILVLCGMCGFLVYGFLAILHDVNAGRADWSAIFAPVFFLLLTTGLTEYLFWPEVPRRRNDITQILLCSSTPRTGGDQTVRGSCTCESLSQVRRVSWAVTSSPVWPEPAIACVAGIVPTAIATASVRRPTPSNGCRVNSATRATPINWSKALTRWFTRPYCVRPGRWFHRQAAKTDLPAFLQANLMGSLQLFQEAVEASVKRCVFISTCAVHDVILNDRPLDETHPLWPKKPLRKPHKAALEAFVHSYGLGEGWPIYALRPTGIYGLAHPPEESKWYGLVGQVMNGASISTAQGGKEVHAADVARAVDLLLNAGAKTIAGQAYNCTDGYIAEQEVAQIAKELSGSASSIADLNRGPKNQIDTSKLRALGMTFGGKALLRQTVQELVGAYSRSRP